MGEAKFTPGPWEAWQEGGDAGPWHVDTPQGTIYVGHLPNGIPDKANSHLIAAAPDLYDALAAVFEPRGATIYLGAEAIDAARAALRKARGEQP